MRGTVIVDELLWYSWTQTVVTITETTPNNVIGSKIKLILLYSFDLQLYNIKIFTGDFDLQWLKHAENS